MLPFVRDPGDVSYFDQRCSNKSNGYLGKVVDIEIDVHDCNCQRWTCEVGETSRMESMGDTITCRPVHGFVLSVNDHQSRIETE